MALEDIGTDRGGKTGQLPSVYEELQKIFREVVDELRVSAQKKGLDASGNLIASISFNPQILGDSFRFTLNMADYYKDVDKGTKPGHQPPIKELLEWMKFKKIVPRNKAGKRLKSEPKQLENLAFAIQRKIYNRGTIKRFGYKGSNFYSEVIPNKADFITRISKRVSEAAKKDVIVDIKYFDK